jgi:hypothetical protein
MHLRAGSSLEDLGDQWCGEVVDCGHLGLQLASERLLGWQSLACLAVLHPTDIRVVHWHMCLACGALVPNLVLGMQRMKLPHGWPLLSQIRVYAFIEDIEAVD